VCSSDLFTHQHRLVMKRNIVLAVLSAGVVGLTGFTVSAAEVQAGVSVQATAPGEPVVQEQTAPAHTVAPARLPYGVEDILKLTHGKVNEEVIVAYIHSTDTIYNLSANDIVFLREQGVSDRVVGTMLDQRQALIASQTAAAQQNAQAQQAANNAAQAQQAQQPAYAQTAPAAEPVSTVYTVPYYSTSYGYPYYSSPYYGGYYGPSFAFSWGYPYYGGGYYGHGCYPYYGHSYYGHGGYYGGGYHGGYNGGLHAQGHVSGGFSAHGSSFGGHASMGHASFSGGGGGGHGGFSAHGGGGHR